MRFLLMVALLSITSGAWAATSDLEWSTHYAHAKSAAASAQKPLLVVIENPAEPSQSFDESRLASDEAQVELMQNFQLCRVDATTDYGKRVARAFGAETFPYTAITDRTAKYITYRQAGQISAESWQSTLESKRTGEQQISWENVLSQPYEVLWTQPSSNCPNCIRNSYR